jgi:hypothetical protein
LGPLHQAAATFYNAVSANKKLKVALLSSSRLAVLIQTSPLHDRQVPSTSHNGIFFENERVRIREIGVQHTSTASDPTCPAEVAVTAAGDALIPTSGISRSRIVLEDFAALCTKSDAERAVSVFPKLSVYQSWTAWWHAIPDFPFPLRCLSKCGASR